MLTVTGPHNRRGRRNAQPFGHEFAIENQKGPADPGQGGQIDPFSRFR
jgi:hypothetical protein